MAPAGWLKPIRCTTYLDNTLIFGDAKQFAGAIMRELSSGHQIGRIPSL
jgi:hypothetical protein